MSRAFVRRALLSITAAAVLAVPAGPLGAETRPSRPASGGIVASDHHLASEVGAEILRQGGNAVDAAVAAAFALAVVHPEAGNVGGGGFLLHHGAAGGATSFDFRERAPRAATETMYLDINGTVRANANHDGPLAVGVPGTVAGLALAHARLGKLDWKRLVQPAVDLARGGFPVTWELVPFMTGLAAAPPHPWYAETRKVFLDGGEPYAPGELLVQPDLARTLERIRDRGRDGFYRGETARLLAAFMAEHGGLITEQDLALYEAVERRPIHGTYRGYDVYGMPPPSSGGTALVEMLNVLEAYDLAALGHGSAAYVHLLAETMRRAFADRAEHLGDPEANPDIPLARLLSKEHAAALRATIDLDHASVSDRNRFAAAFLAAEESRDTTHLSVVDAEGNAVALTYTLEESWGSRMVVAGAGFLLNNEMGDFNPVPGVTTTDGQIGTPPNRISPGKRMLSSMSPTIVARAGRPVLVAGSYGGRTIINTVLQVVLAVLDHGMTAAEAVAAPRVHHQWLPDELLVEPWGLSPDTLALLRARGHVVVVADESQGRAPTLVIDPATGLRFGASDPRSFNGAAVAQ